MTKNTSKSDALKALDELGLTGGTKANKNKERIAKHVKSGESITGNKENWTPEYMEARRLCVVLADRRKKLGIPAGSRILVGDKFAFKKDGEQVYNNLDPKAKDALLQAEAYIEKLLSGEVKLEEALSEALAEAPAEATGEAQADEEL